MLHFQEAEPILEELEREFHFALSIFIKYQALSPIVLALRHNLFLNLNQLDI